MPYTRQELLAAVRADHPQLAGIEDNKLFAAIAVDHPDLAKGISELQPPAPAQPIPGDSVLGPLIGGVGPSAFGQRIAGAAASLLNPLFPAGDVRQPNAQMPSMSPEQDIGAKAVTIGAGIDAASNAANPLAAAIQARLPRAIKAGASQKFDAISNAIGGQVGNYASAEPTIREAQALNLDTKATIPGPMRGYISNTQSPVPTSNYVTYDQGRRMASGAGQLSEFETARTNQAMQYQLKQFSRAMDEGNRELAVKNGLGPVYDAAMKEWAKGQSLENKAEIISRWGKKILIAATLGGTAAMGGRAIMDLYENRR